MALVGILPTVPVYVAGYVRLSGGHPLRVAAIAGLAVLAFVWGVFEGALDYELYRGALFTEGGFAAW
jgi:hypothetical protein